VLIARDAFAQEESERVQIDFRVVRQVTAFRIDCRGGYPPKRLRIRS
jgi:hypothetical protein